MKRLKLILISEEKKIFNPLFSANVHFKSNSGIRNPFTLDMENRSVQLNLLLTELKIQVLETNRGLASLRVAFVQ